MAEASDWNLGMKAPFPVLNGGYHIVTFSLPHAEIDTSSVLNFV